MIQACSQHTLRDGRVLTLRPPVQEDAALLIDYMKRVGAETDYLLCDENGIPGMTIERETGWIELTRNAENTAMYLGFAEGELVALFDIRAEGRPRIAHNATLALTITRAYWRLGIGSIAMQTMLGFAKATGCIKNLNLEVRADNARAVSLYERFGFTIVARRKDRVCIRGAYFDELLMERGV